MDEKELISKIKELRQIKPREEWVLLTKNQVFSLDRKSTFSERFSEFLEIFPRIFSQYKPALVSLILVGALLGTFGFAQNALPGDLLYTLKKITEKSRAIFVSKEEKPKASLELANKRLEELTKIAEQNQVKKLAPAIEEYQQSFSEVTKIASQIKEPKQVRKILPKIAELEKNIENLKSYGVEVGEAENTEGLYKPMAESLIKDLEGRSLTENQLKILEEAKKLYEEGDFSSALTKVLEASQIQ